MSSATNTNTGIPLTGDIGSKEAPWHAAFPKATVEADYLPSEEVLKELQDEEKKKGVLLVDLRRNDHDVSPLHGAGGLRRMRLNHQG